MEVFPNQKVYLLKYNDLLVKEKQDTLVGASRKKEEKQKSMDVVNKTKQNKNSHEYGLCNVRSD